MDPAVQAAVLPYMRSELDARGLTSVRISASDETNYDTARSTWNSFGASTKALVSQVNVHGYQGANGRRDLLYTDVVTTAARSSGTRKRATATAPAGPSPATSVTTSAGCTPRPGSTGR